MLCALSFLLFSLVQASLFVLSPPEVRAQFEAKYAKGQIPASMGNFGNPPYGSTITGLLVDEKSTACSALSPLGDLEHNATPVLMLDRGDCAFVVKVRNAQNIGARAVIIVNSDDSDVEKIVMTDNGAAGNLDIPAFLIRREDGTILRNMVEGRFSQIYMSIGFEVPKSAGSTAEVSIWLQSSDETGMKLLSDFSPYAAKLPNLHFEPHYLTWRCPVCESGGFRSPNNECLSGGRYCAYDPDGPGSLEGSDVVLENLRELCLYRTVQGQHKRWFQYIQHFYQNCYHGFAENCRKEALDKAGVREEEIKKCVDSSVMGENIMVDDNVLLKEELEKWYQEMVFFSPAIYINNMLFRGDLEAKLLLAAICSSFAEGFKPEICKTDPDRITTDRNKNDLWLVIVIIIAVLSIVGILAVYRIWISTELRNDMKIQVNDAVERYFQLVEPK
jgi:hypothetical protein